MLTDIEIASILAGSIAGLYLLGAFVWSIAFPDRRVWPPKKATMGIKLRVWIATIAIFGPQYVADMIILVGWAMLSASGWAVSVAGIGVVVLASAPFAEEPWLAENYGGQFHEYKARVRRYI